MTQLLTPFLPGVSESLPLTDRILLAEDNELFANLVRNYLESDGQHVDVVYNADMLYDMDQSRYKAVVVNYSLPGLDTYDFVEQLATDVETCGVAVIVMYTDATESRAYEVLDAGADSILRKPFSMKELSARLRSVLRRRRVKLSHVRKVRRVVHDTLMVDLVSCDVTINDKSLQLPRRPAELLGFLMYHKNHFYNAKELGVLLWPGQPELHTDIMLNSMIIQIKQRLGRYGLYLHGEARYAYAYYGDE